MSYLLLNTYSTPNRIVSFVKILPIVERLDSSHRL